MHFEQRSMQRFFVTRYLPAMALCAAMQPAWSQTATATSESGLDEIVVTATRRSAALIDTAASISAIGSDALKPGGVQDISDLAQEVPNMSVGNQFGVNRTFIRGIGLTSIDLGADGAVAFLQNGAQIPLPAQQLSGFYDLDRVRQLCRQAFRGCDRRPDYRHYFGSHRHQHREAKRLRQQSIHGHADR